VANTAGDGVRHAPYGLFGGRDGRVHRYRLVAGGPARAPAGGMPRPLAGTTRPRSTRVLRTKEVGIPVPPGAVFLIESSGGGGYGPPSRRDRGAREADVVNGFVTGRRGPRRRPAARPRTRSGPGPRR
jgi:N-methylhydantoinase B